MEGWRAGGLEAWRPGGLEAWRPGRLEGDLEVKIEDEDVDRGEPGNFNGDIK